MPGFTELLLHLTNSAFLQIGYLWLPCVKQVYWSHLSNSTIFTLNSMYLFIFKHFILYWGIAMNNVVIVSGQ